MLEYLNSLGYDKKAIDKLLKNKRFHVTDKSFLIKNIDEIWSLFTKIGFKKLEIIKITKNEPSLLEYDCNTLENKIDEFLKMGFKDKELFKMIKLYPTILVLDIQKIINRIDFWIGLGFSHKEVFSMVKTFPSIIGYSKAYCVDRIDDLEKCGYTMSDIRKMTVAYPQLFSLCIQNIQTRLDDLEYYGLTCEQIKKITLGYPKIFGYSKKNVKEKIICYKKLNIIKFVVEHPMYLIGGVALIQARANYLSQIEYDYENNPRNLFLNNTSFKRRFKISKEDLLSKYGKGQKSGILN